jgi:acyl dehydratase
VLPTFVVIGGMGTPTPSYGTFDAAMLVHGEQRIELHRELPVAGTALITGRVTAVYDKGSAAVIWTEAVAIDASDGQPLFTASMSWFIRGEGGFGGDRGPSTSKEGPPERDPDHVVTYSTRTDQALLYRLSGDRNPLHSDPTFAERAGFDRPILHGLCTFGFTGRALLHSLCGSDPSRFTGMDARFSSPVYPGDDLTVKMWVVGDGEAVYRTERGNGEIVIDQGRCTFTA